MINQNWIFGNSAGISFNSTTPNSFTIPNPAGERKFDTWEGCATVSDENGDLLFYTEGSFIWKADGTTIKDGNNDYRMKGDKTSSQSAIICPDPANNKQYYILTADGNSFGNDGVSNLFNGVLINVDTWAITEIIPNLMSSPPTTTKMSPAEKITIVRTPNCKEYWVLAAFQTGINPSAQKGNGLIQVYKIDDTGIAFVTQVDLNVEIADVGYMKCSHDSKLLAIASTTTNKVHLFPFNNTTGDITVGQINALDIPEPYGIEFSPDNNILYVSRIGYRKSQNFLYQVDLTQAVFSPVLLETFNRQPGQTRHIIGAIQLGPDNKIYISRDQYKKVGVIHKPNVLGSGCTIDIDYITLLSGHSNIGLPNLLTELCPPAPCDCDCDCDSNCYTCNKDAEAQNEELAERAKQKATIVKSNEDDFDPFLEECPHKVAIQNAAALEPSFYFHWGDGAKDQIEEHDTEVFYLTVCNPYTDIQFNGVRLTKISLIPDVDDLDKIQIVPDRFITLDCLKPCACQTREFALITRDSNLTGQYKLVVDYCIENITVAGGMHKGTTEFEVKITED